MASEKTPVVWDDDAKKHRPLGSGEKMGGLDASSLLSSDSGNLLEAGSDGLAYLSGSGIVDPRADNFLEESDRGKLQVTADRIAEWLDGHPQDAAAVAEAINAVSGDEGNVIAAGSDKGAFMSKNALASAISTMNASQLSMLNNALRKAGGGLNVDSATGKLVVDFGSMDPDIMRGVVLSMVQQGGGISVDANGQLYVDFDSMPTDKFESLLGSLKMQIPLEADKALFVNSSTGVDDASDGRGLSPEKPFRTIQACVTYATDTFSLGNHTIVIYVEGGMVYVENIVLPDFTRTSGHIVLRARDFANPPIITTPPNISVVNLVSVRGGAWRFERLRLLATHSSDGSNLNYFPSCIAAAGGSTDLSIVGCSIESTYNGASHSGYYEIRHVASYDGALITFNVMPGYSNSMVVNSGNVSAVNFLHAENLAKISIPSDNIESSGGNYNVVCNGTCDFFAFANNNANIYVIGGGQHYQSFTGTVTGKQYAVINGSGMLAPQGGFPGTAEGSNVDSATFSWYKEYSE